MVNEPEVTGEDPNRDEATAEEAESEVEVIAEDDVVVELKPEPDPLAKAQEDLRSTQARLRTVSKAYTDLQGEMASFKKRAEGQANLKAVKRTADLVSALLEPVENLRRSVDNAGEDIESLTAGLKLVVHQFSEAMNRVGLRETGKVGDLFDPRRHEALAMTPVTDRSMDGRILMVHNTGYVLGDNVLQAAQVIVGKLEVQAPPPAAEPEEEPEAQPEDQAEATDDTPSDA